MQTHKIGNSGTIVTAFGLGGTGLGNLYRAVDDQAAHELVTVAYANGIRYFDTAPVYGLGLSELRLGRSLTALRREDFVLSSKVGYKLVPLREGEPTWDLWDQSPPFRHEYDFSYDGAMRSIEESLLRLKLDRLDLVAIHDPDEGVGNDPGADPYSKSHFSEAMEGAYRALHRLRAEGAIGGIGVGINQWQMLTDFAGAGEFDYFLLAGRYTLLEQTCLHTLLPLCLERHISVVIGGPFNSGILASGAAESAYYNYVPATPEILARVRLLERCCMDFDISLRAAALQFPLGHPAVASVIPGARSAAELQQNLAALRESIPSAFWDELKSRGLIDLAAPISGVKQ
jgi:D-threo-aldose 1-dehydrogenase